MRVCHFSPNPRDFFSLHLFFSGVPPNPQPLKRWLWEEGCLKKPGISETNCPVCFTLSPACLLVTIWMFVKRWLNPLPCLGTAVFHSSEAWVRDTAKLSTTMSSVYLLNEVLGKRKRFYLWLWGSPCKFCKLSHMSVPFNHLSFENVFWFCFCPSESSEWWLWELQLIDLLRRPHPISIALHYLKKSS